LGEKLRGFLNSCKQILKTPLKGNLIKLQNTLHQLPFLNELYVYSFVKIQNSNLIDKNYQLVSFRSQQLSQIKTLKFNVKESTSELRRKIKAANSEIEKLVKKTGKLEIQQKGLIYTLEILKQKLNNNSKKQELTCKKCLKLFTEKSNFNWSCRTHSQDYQGGVFYCCGKTDINSLGCTLSKHTSENSIKRNQRLKPTVCTSCRGIGHLAHECIRDPNAVKLIASKPKRKKIIFNELFPEIKECKFNMSYADISEKDIWTEEFADIYQLKTFNR